MRSGPCQLRRAVRPGLAVWRLQRTPPQPSPNPQGDKQCGPTASSDLSRGEWPSVEPPSYRHVHVPGRSGSSHLASKTEEKPERMLKCDSDHVVSECSPRSAPAGPAVRGVELLRAGSLGESDEPLTPAGAAGRWLRVAPASQEAGSRGARSGRQVREEGLLCPGHSARHGAGGTKREKIPGFSKST